MSREQRGVRAWLLGALLASCATAASAGIHTWDVNEVFSNADGSIQFIELWEADGGTSEVNVGNATVTSDTRSFTMTEGQVTAPTTHKYFLLATAGFAALPGAPLPDAIIPAGLVPFFSTSGDTIDYQIYDSWTFGAVPTNGTDSLDRMTGVGPNTPTNYAGDTGSVDAGAPGPPAIPSAPVPLLLVALGALMALGSVSLLWTRQLR